MSSLYAKYIKERTNTEILEIEEGFATYSFNTEGVYIQDIFVDKEFRRGDMAAAMADQIAHEAVNKGLKQMFGSVCLDAINPGDSMRVLLAYGMVPFSVKGNTIYFKKDIGR